MVPRITPMSYWLRTGMMVPADVLERKFNPNHNPKNGQFMNGAGGGKTAKKPSAKTTPKPKVDPIDSKTIGRITVGQASNILTNETNGLSGGRPGELASAKTALANVIVNGQLAARPPDVAPSTLSHQAATSSGREDDQIIMRQVYNARLKNMPDPVNGSFYYGTSTSVMSFRRVTSLRPLQRWWRTPMSTTFR